MTILDVATDTDDNIYLLLRLKTGAMTSFCWGDELTKRVSQNASEEKSVTDNKRVTQVGKEMEHRLRQQRTANELEEANRRVMEDQKNILRAMVWAADGSSEMEVGFTTKPKLNEEYQDAIFVLSCDGNLRYMFPLVGFPYYHLTVNDNDRVLALRKPFSVEREVVIDVYETYGEFFHSFKERRFKDICCMTAASNGSVMMMDKGDSRIHFIGEMGEHLLMLKIDRSFLFPRVGFLQASEQVVVAGEEEGRGCLHLQV